MVLSVLRLRSDIWFDLSKDLEEVEESGCRSECVRRLPVKPST